MLIRLLALVAEHKTALTTDGLAAHLGIQARMVEPLLRTLTDFGYLAAAGQGCSSRACAGCRQHRSCGIAPAARLWTLTPKGQAAARNQNQHLT